MDDGSAAFYDFKSLIYYKIEGKDCKIISQYK